MSLISTLLLKLSPLYLNIALGYIAGKFLDMPREVLARFMFYIISPLIMFNGVLHTRIDGSVLSLPILVFCLSCLLCLSFYRVAENIWRDSSKNLIAFSAGTGNTGYFGLPLALLLFDEQGEGLYMMALMGITIYENSLGFYICAKGTHTPKECLHKLIRLPILHAFLLALLLNYMQVPMPMIFTEFMSHIKGTYMVLGMMIIGLGLAALRHLKLDLAFIGISFAAKFLAWPLLALGIVYVDSQWLGFYSKDIHQALILLSVVPLAVNTVILATILKTEPEKAAAAVLLSTLFAILYVPVMVIYFVLNSTDFFAEFTAVVR